ncbi:uncharacterized protein LOC105849459 isoform X3 [Hydra vulgaris]|uniref:uncharacterized protein LOC105849459 isoform X3 n=1 Tax=Hydra vulgaris TaxID=6087 RepID=UPI001F5F8E30|nr:uncharacterized protein LOC105849459 isoform X3 [Hydra vulgaris]
MASNIFLPANVKQWDLLDCCSWLDSIGLTNYIDAFKGEDIDGSIINEIDDFMLKELIPPIKDRIIFKKELASKNVICVRSSSPTLNSCNVSFTLSPVCDNNEAPTISESFIQSDKLTLPPILLAAVERKEIDFSIPKRSKLKEYVMDFLFDVMKQQYGLFPSTSNFYEIANELFLRYPSLKPRHCNGSELLVHLLKAKFKRVRRPLLNDEQVAQFKIKYSRINSGRKRNSVLLNESVNLCSAKRHCHHSSDKLFAAARVITNTDIDNNCLLLLGRMKEGMKKLIDLKKPLSARWQTLCNGVLDEISDATIKNLHCLILPSIFCDEEALLFTMTLDPIYPTPALKIEGDVINPTRISLVVDGLTLSNSVPDVTCGLGLVICSYYIFDIAYPKKLQKTLSFLEHYVFERRSKLPANIQNIASFLNL